MKNYIYLLLIIVLLSSTQITNAQDGFKFFDKGKKYEDVNFQLINNLVVVPLEINGKKAKLYFRYRSK